MTLCARSHQHIQEALRRRAKLEALSLSVLRLQLIEEVVTARFGPALVLPRSAAAVVAAIYNPSSRLHSYEILASAAERLLARGPELTHHVSASLRPASVLPNESLIFDVEEWRSE